jgi:hypothetical protein
MVLEDPLWQDGNDYPARLDRQFIEDVFDVEGVIKPAGGALKVSPRAAGANMSVDVAAGRAVVRGDDEANQGHYRVISTAVENLPVGAAPGSDSRIDLIVARVRDAAVTGGVSSDWLLEVIPGAVAAAPVAPAVPPTAIPLAEVLVAAGTASIDAAKITDRRTAAANAAYLATSANLSDVASAATARANLGADAAYLARAEAKGGFVATTESTTSTTYADLATVGPSVTVDIRDDGSGAGRALVIVGGRMSNNTAGATSAMSVAGPGLTPSDTTALTNQNESTSSLLIASHVFIASGLTPGSATYTAKYRVSGGTGSFSSRRLAIIPL